MTQSLYIEGERAENLQPGDFILTHRRSLITSLISFGQSLRNEWTLAGYTHAALVLSEDGDLAEALDKGVVEGHIRNYDREHYRLFRVRASSHDQVQILNFADSVLDARWEYSYLTIASIILQLATGSTLTFSRAGTAICSGFVAEALVRAGFVFDKPPHVMMPADLAREFGAE